MLPEDPRELEELDALAAELEEAGHVARVAIASRELPDPAFATRLRLQLISGGFEIRPAAPGVAPVPPTRPLELPIAVERRSPNRPFAEDHMVAASSPDGEVDGVLAQVGPEEGRRWARRDSRRAAAARPAGLPDTEPMDREAERTGHVGALRPAMGWRIPTHLLPARWVAVGLAASLVVASFLYGTTMLFPTRPYALADSASSATLVRNGATSVLAQGTELYEGDEIRIASGGEATLSMGTSFARMAAGSDIRLDSVDPSSILLAQLGGRVYHRAVVSSKGKYQVMTGSVEWTSKGTAFDLDRHSAASGGEEVRGLALLDGLNLTGPALQAALSQGQSALVELGAQGAPLTAPEVGSIDAAALAGDSWLVENARLDNLQGLDLGELAALLSPTPRPSATPAIAHIETPATEPTPTRAPTSATTAPTRKPTPKPTPTGPANLGKLTIVKNGDGTYTFSWPKYEGPGFQYYKLVYGPAGTKPTFNGSNYWACNETVDATSWTGAIDIGNYAVRLQVIDETSGTVIRAQTNVVALKVAAPTPTLPATQNLGALNVTDEGDGKYSFSWAPYTGGWDFEAYKLVYVPGSGSPSYTSGADYWAALGTGDTSAGPITISSGEWSIRIQAIGWPFGGDAYVFGQTSVYHLTVP